MPSYSIIYPNPQSSIHNLQSLMVNFIPDWTFVGYFSIVFWMNFINNQLKLMFSKKWRVWSRNGWNVHLNKDAWVCQIYQLPGLLKWLIAHRHKNQHLNTDLWTTCFSSSERSEWSESSKQMNTMNAVSESGWGWVRLYFLKTQLWLVHIIEISI